MLKLTVQNLKDGMRSMLQLAQWKPANLKLAYNIGRTWKDYKDRLTEAEEIERDIYKDFGATEKMNPGGQLVLNLPEDLTIEKRKEFDAKIKELHAMEMEVWGHQLSFESLEKVNAPLSGDDFSLLAWLIAEPIEAAPDPAEKAQTQTA